MTIQAVLRDPVKKDGTRSLKIRISTKGDVCFINTGISVIPDEFDSKRGLLKDTTPDNIKLNAKITEIIAKYTKITSQLHHRIERYGAKKIREILMSYDRENSKYVYIGEDDGFYMEAAKLIADLQMDNRTGHAENILTTVNVLRKFNGDRTLSFDYITPIFLKDFKRWFLKERGKEVTFNKHLRNIRLVFNEAMRNRVISRNIYPFDFVSIPSDYEAEIRCVDADILTRLYGCEGLGRDMFFLSFFFCGMNIKDIVELPYSEGYIDTKRAKTSRTARKVRLRLLIQPEAKEIIERYADPKKKKLIVTKYANLPTLRWCINDSIRKSCNELNIPRMSFTYARHSWATIAGELDVPDTIIDKALMHSTSGKMIEKYRQFDFSKVDRANRMVMNHVLGIEKEKPE